MFGGFSGFTVVTSESKVGLVVGNKFEEFPETFLLVKISLVQFNSKSRGNADLVLSLCFQI